MLCGDSILLAGRLFSTSSCVRFMDLLSVLFLGIGAGMVLAIPSMFLIGSESSRDYPIGGFLPMGMVPFLSGDSKLALAGILLVGGMLGFNLIVYFYRGRAALGVAVAHAMGHGHGHDDHEHDSGHEDPAPVESNSGGQVIVGKSLAEFL